LRTLRKGGILVSNARLAVKDEYNQVFTEPLPGFLSDLFGITVDDYDVIKGTENRKIIIRKDSPILAGKEIPPYGWVEALSAIDAETLAFHKGEWLEGKSAITRRRYGRGEAIYVGTFLSSDLAVLIVRDFIIKGLIKPVTRLRDAEVEIVMREGKDFCLLFVINHADRPKKIKMPLQRSFTVESFNGKISETDILTINLEADDVKVYILR